MKKDTSKRRIASVCLKVASVCARVAAITLPASSRGGHLLAGYDHRRRDAAEAR